jgi:hypothetical protein
MVDDPNAAAQPYSPAFLQADAFVAAHEGTKLVIDSNGFPTKYGINQRWHPDVDVSKLTAEQAQKIRHDEYWNAISGDTLASKDPKIAMMAYDTSILAGANAAKKQILDSNGDPATMYQKRVDFLKSLADADPKKAAYIDNWMNRTNELAATAGITPSAQPEQKSPLTPTAPLEPTPVEKAGDALQQGFAGAAKGGQEAAPTPAIPTTKPTVAMPTESVVPTQKDMYAKALEKIAQRNAASPDHQGSPVYKGPPTAQGQAVPPQGPVAPAQPAAQPQQEAQTQNDNEA